MSAVWVREHDRNIWHRAASDADVRMKCGAEIGGSPLLDRHDDPVGPKCWACDQITGTALWDAAKLLVAIDPIAENFHAELGRRGDCFGFGHDHIPLEDVERFLDAVDVLRKVAKS